MSQKYKVFIDNIELFFVTEEIVGVQILLGRFFPENVTVLKETISELGGKQMQFVSKNPKRTFKRFFKAFNYVKAAGGLVARGDELLFIFRNGKWDLPKGKLEINESSKIAARREVVEECGLIKKPKIVGKIVNTYHVYEMNGASFLKKTNWYLMQYNGTEPLLAQKEEGITKACWVKPSALATKRKNCYPSILTVLDRISLPVAD